MQTDQTLDKKIDDKYKGTHKLNRNKGLKLKTILIKKIFKWFLSENKQNASNAISSKSKNVFFGTVSIVHQIYCFIILLNDFVYFESP